MESKHVLELKDFLISKGLTEGTTKFEFELRAMKIKKCLEYNGLNTCSNCRNYMFCSIIEQQYRQGIQ